jgi:hypothetical protein
LGDVDEEVKRGFDGARHRGFMKDAEGIKGSA